MDPLTQIALTRELVDIDSTTGREARGRRAGSRRTLRALRLRRRPSSRSLGDASTSSRRSARAGASSSRRTSIACRRSFRAARPTALLYGRGACDAKGISRRADRGGRAAARGRRARVGLLFVVGEERGQRRREGREHPRAGAIEVPDQRRADRQSARHRDARRVSREADGDRPRRALEPARARRVGDREAARRARSRCARIEWPTIRRSAGRTTRSGSSTAASRRTSIPPHAEAEVMFRTVGDFADDSRARSTRISAPLVALEDVLVVPPVRLQDGAPASTRRCSRSRPTFRCSIAGARRCCSGPGSVTRRAHGQRARRDCRAPPGRGSLRRRSPAL